MTARPEAAAIWDAQTRVGIMLEIQTHAVEIVREVDADDTVLAVQLSRATDLLIDDVDLLMAALKTQALAFRPAPSIALKLAGHYAEFQRTKERLAMARFEIATCAISGVSPLVEAQVAERLGLFVEQIAIQGVPRDHHAAYFSGLAVVALSIERLAVEMGEMQAARTPETEEIIGLADQIRLTALAALEPAGLQPEYDISDAAAKITIPMDSALHRLAGMVGNLSAAPAALSAPGDPVLDMDTIFTRVFGRDAMGTA